MVKRHRECCQAEAKQYSLLWPEVVEQVIRVYTPHGTSMMLMTIERGQAGWIGDSRQYDAMIMTGPVFHSRVLTYTANDMDESLSKGQLDHLLCTPRKPGSEGES